MYPWLRSSTVFWLTALGAAALLIAAYIPGLSGAMYYDDYGNLERLGEVGSWSQAVTFAHQGISSPIGRPLALWTFVPHASGWPHNAAEILAVNLAIHLCNAVLVGVLAWQLLGLVVQHRDAPPPNGAAAQRREYGLRSRYGTLLVAALWAAMPLLASTNLIVIQRMASLAALFVLLGLIGFVWAQLRWQSRPALGFWIGLLLLGGCTALGILAKENSALAPVLALWIALFFLPSQAKLGRWALARNEFLLASLVFLLWYISPLRFDWATVYDIRGWSPWERVQTEWVVLWDYVHHALAPHPNAFSPFHDHWKSLAGTTTAMWAGLAWLSALLATLWLAHSRISPWPLFALLWFFTAHLLESTSLNLELKFEHRNYFAFFGAILAIVIMTLNAPARVRRALLALLLVFGALQFVLLFSLTSLWGQPLLAARVWYAENPGSSRLLTHLNVQESVVLGRESEFAGNAAALEQQRQQMRLERADRTLAQCPECLGLHVEALALSCKAAPPSERVRRLETALAAARKPDGRAMTLRPTIKMMFDLRDIVVAERCPPLQAEDLRPLLSALAEHPFFNAVHLAGRILFLNAMLAEDAGDRAGRDAWLRRAEARAPTALPVLEYQVHSSLSEGRLEDARSAIARRRSLAREGTVMTDQVLDDLQSLIDGSQQPTRSDT
ncbi:MAG: hypothetical protein K9L32_04110 [Chromatiaceae bacterium]|nr:hypothetical protein [Chromatiaceae bacterium]MCF8003386.1 hypothetical protein [Chromatiaceae bacterium]